MEKKSRLINMFLVVFIFFGIIAIYTVGVIIPKIKADNIIKEKAIMVAAKRVEDKNIADKLISDKIIEDKRIADKVIEDKRIADQIIEDKKIEDKRIADKKIEDKKIAVEKARLVRVENDRINAIKREEKRIIDEKARKASVVTLKYTIDGEWITACNYPNGCTLQLKVGQSIKLRETMLNGSTRRVMYMNGGDIFGEDFSNNRIKMIAVGGDDITIIPDKYSWENAYTFHVVVSE